jgi:hypothetical protein
MPSSRGLRAVVSALALSFFLCNVARAETSAADKSAARQVATEGIQLFNAEKYEDALDRMRRAQALYDAPVHLLYIARAEAKLGLLVEASEHYRQLDHYTLPPNPPEAWSAAVEDGRKELAAVEPRIPKLRVMTEPQVWNAGLRIDGADVSSAAVGIPRPINPGKHRVELATPGQPWSAAEVDVAEATTRDVVFRVQPGGAAAPKVTAGVVAANAAEPGEPAPGAAGAPPKEDPFVGFLGGLRLGLAVPTGTVFNFRPENNTTFSREVEMSDVAKPGGSLEFHAGIRLGRYFTPIFFLAGQALAHPARFDLTGLGDAFALELKSATAGTFGIGLLFGTPPGKIGAFGEFGIGLIDVLSVEFKNAAPDSGNCKIDARGASLRFGGGAIIPTVKWLHVTPVAHVTLGQFTKTSTSGCSDAVPSDIASADQRTHGMIFLGVGGDVVIGGRR